MLRIRKENQQTPTIPKANRIREGSRVADVLIYLAAALVAFITIYPMYYVLILSLSDPIYSLSMHVYVIPKGLYFGGYQRIFGDAVLWRSYGNTILYALGMMVLMLFTCSTFAYSLSSRQLKGRKIINWILIIPMYFNGGVIPLFMLIMQMGLYNTPWALIFLGGYSVWYIILMKSYMNSIPDSMRESAFIDGANHYQTLIHIVLPTIKPIVAVIALYTIINAWNGWYNAALYIVDYKLQPLQIYLRRILIQRTVDLTGDLSGAEFIALQKAQLSNEQLKFTVIIVSSLPMLIASPFFQQYLVKGVMLGSLKE